MNHDLVRAIVDKCLIEFVYKVGQTQIVEPHVYGIRHGIECVLGLQISGESQGGASRGWKQFDVDIETNITIETVTVADLPAEWRTYPAPTALAMIGERWLRESTSAVLSVPSAVIPTERNFILNPTHAGVARLVINPSEPFSFDPRMWKTTG